MRYLSDAWLAAADHAVSTAATPAPVTLIVDQSVTGVGRWRVVVDPAGSSVGRLARCGAEHPEFAEEPDAEFTQSLDTARDVARGTLDAHQALLLGSIEFRGHADRVIAGRAALAWLSEALAPLIQRTEWD